MPYHGLITTPSVQSRDTRCTSKQKNLIFSQAELQAIKTKPTMAQMLGLEKENSRAAIINAFKELKEENLQLKKKKKPTTKNIWHGYHFS